SKKTVNVQLIVDASGSMAAATDTGVLRIDAAKQVLAQVISAIPDVEGVNVGLRVYGHKGDNTEAGRAESCLSSDLLVPMLGVDATQLTAQANALQPVGWTPLGFSLQEAAKDFKEPASDNVVNAIVMVTDGLETCDADPVAIAGELHKSPAGITTHVIGFGTTAEEQATLNGIAKAGGGQLLGSNNAGQLMDALFSILEKLDVVAETGTGETRDSPLGVGRIGKVGDYNVSVLSVDPEVPGNDTVGKVPFRARVSVTYTGTTTGKPGNDLEFNSVGDLSSSYNLSKDSCGLAGRGPDAINELFTGGSAEFSVCWSIEPEDVSSLLMYVKSRIASPSDAVWFSLERSAAQSGAAPHQAELSLLDIKFEPAELTIPANTEVSVTITNSGVLQHNLVLDEVGGDSGLLNGGESVTVTLNLPPGTYQFYCSVPGHKEAGMVGTLIVE
ncbi:MAG: cupredoxin domain-containing protein, partial [Thermomicrobiales bacterium]